jgi:CRP-like cAMP-binding protein
MLGELCNWRLHLRRDRVIYDEGDPSLTMYRIEKGCVRLQVNGPTGGRQIIAFLVEGDSFGFCLKRRNASAEAVTAVELVCTSIHAILTQARRDPSVLAELLDGANRHYGSLAHHLERMAHLNATERVLAFVADEASRHREAGPAERLVLRMNRHDIADFLGLEPETVSRAFQNLEAKGVLTRQGRVGLLLHARALAYAAHRTREMAAANPAA